MKKSQKSTLYCCITVKFTYNATALGQENGPLKMLRVVPSCAVSNMFSAQNKPCATYSATKTSIVNQRCPINYSNHSNSVYVRKIIPNELALKKKHGYLMKSFRRSKSRFSERKGSISFYHILSTGFSNTCFSFQYC